MTHVERFHDRSPSPASLANESRTSGPRARRGRERTTGRGGRRSSIARRVSLLLAVTGSVGVLLAWGCNDEPSSLMGGTTSTAAGGSAPAAPASTENAAIVAGQDTFRHDTFGDEAFWSDELGLHRALLGAKNGGTGAGLGLRAAMRLGLKIDSEALDADLSRAIADGSADMDAPANLVGALRSNAVVGLTGFFDDAGSLTSVGLTCALCHSTVDDSVGSGMGRRLDGRANRDLDAGALLALAPDLTKLAIKLRTSEATVRETLAAWGPGKFDSVLFLDGRAADDEGKSGATLIPPLYGGGSNGLATYTGFGSTLYWSALEANLVLQGEGTFVDDRLGDAKAFPVASANKSGQTFSLHDRITPKLADLDLYLTSLVPPPADTAGFDAGAAARGHDVFLNEARCSRCHFDGSGSVPGLPLHSAGELGIDDFAAGRSPGDRYRTTPLRGLGTHAKGGFYHDGRFATLDAVVDHYDGQFELGLDRRQKADLVQYLLSL